VSCGKTKKCKILDPENDFQTLVTLPDHNGTILNAEYIPDPYNILVTSSADLCIRFWSTENDFDSIHQEQLDVSQTVIKYYEKKDILFTASRVGEISMWKWGIVPEEYRRKDTKSLGMHVNKTKKSSSMTLTNSNREMFYIQRSFKLHDDIINDVLLMPKEDRMITCSLDSTIKIYDIEKEKVRNELTGHKQGVFAVTWSNDYHFLVSAGFEHEALVWIANVETTPFKLRDQRKPHQHSLVNVCAVPNSPQVITADHKGMVKIWDIRTFQCIQTIYTESNLPKHDYKNFYLNSFTYMAKRKQIIAAGKKIHVYEYERTQNPTCADDQPLFTAIYNSMSFTFLTAAGRDVKIWDALTGSISRVYRNLTESEITALCIDDRGRKFFVGTHEGDVLCFNYSNGQFVKSFAKHDSEVSSLSYTEETKQVISTSWDKSVRVVNDRDSAEGHVSKFKVLGHHPEEIKCSAYARSHNLVVTGDIGNRIVVFDTKNGNKLHEWLNKNRAEVCALRFLNVLPAFVSADTAGNLRLWTVKPYLYPYHMLLEWKNYAIQRSNKLGASMDAPTLTANDMSESITLGSTTPERRSTTVNNNNNNNMLPPVPVTAMDFDPLSNCLYTGDVKGYICVWDLSDVVERAYLRHSSRYANAATMNEIRNSMGKFAFSKMTRKYYWKAHNEAVRCIQIIKEPAAVLTCSYDSQVVIWTRTGKRMDSLRQENNGDTDQDENDLDDKPFNFPINLDKRRQEDANTVSSVITKIKKQLRIINLWKVKSKQSLLSKSTSMKNLTKRLQEEPRVPTTEDEKLPRPPQTAPAVLPTIRTIFDSPTKDKSGKTLEPIPSDSPKNLDSIINGSKASRRASMQRNSLRLPSLGQQQIKKIITNVAASVESDYSSSGGESEAESGESFYITQRTPSPFP
jgi:WD40 repeat protein